MPGANEEVGNLAVKVSMDMTGFQNGISNLNRQMRVVQSEFQAATAGLNNFENTAEGLKLKVESLTKQIDLHRQKVAALEAAYAKSAETKGTDAKATQELEIKLNKARAALTEVEKNLKNTTTELEKQANSWYKTSQSAEAAGNKMKTVGKEISGAGKELTTKVTLPLLAIGAASTKLAMEAEESENLFEVSMGNMAGAARKWSQDISSSLKLNEYEVRKNVATFNVMLGSMGLTEQQAYDMSAGMTQLAYDMASFYNLPVDQAFQKLRSGISGEAEPLKQLGIIVSDNQVKTYAYTNGIARQGEALTEQQKIMARYGLIMESTSKAQGDLARTLDSPTNKVRSLGEQAKQAGVQIGQFLIPVLSILLSVLQPLLTWFINLTEGQQKFVIILAGIAAGIGPVLIGIGNLVIAVGNITLAFSAVSAAVAKAGGVIGLITSPIGIALIAITALAGAGYLIYKNWDAIKAFFSSLWESIKEIFNTACNTILVFLQQWGPLILAAATGPVGLIVYGIIKHWDDIKAKTLEIWNSVKEAVVGAFQWMYNHNYYFENLVNFIREAWNIIFNDAQYIWNTVTSALVAIWTTLQETVKVIWTAISTVTNTVWTGIYNTLFTLWQRLKAQASEAWSSISATIGNVLNSISSAFTSMVNSAFNWGRNLIGNFIEGINSAISRLKEIASRAAGAVSDFFGFHSPTRLGPGADADTWAPNLIRMFAEGIRASLPQLQTSLNEMALTLSPAGIGSVRNNYATYNNGGNTLIFQVSSSSSEGQAEEILRILRRQGVRI